MAKAKREFRMKLGQQQLFKLVKIANARKTSVNAIIRELVDEYVEQCGAGEKTAQRNI